MAAEVPPYSEQMTDREVSFTRRMLRCRGDGQKNQRPFWFCRRRTTPLGSSGVAPCESEYVLGAAADQSVLARPPRVIVETVRVRVYPDWFAPVAITGPFVVLIGGLLLVRLLRK
jgi:hypothetical protein